MSYRLRKHTLEKADHSTAGSSVVVISQFIDKPWIGDENHSLPLCVYTVV